MLVKDLRIWKAHPQRETQIKLIYINKLVIFWNKFCPLTFNFVLILDSGLKQIARSIYTLSTVILFVRNQDYSTEVDFVSRIFTDFPVLLGVQRSFPCVVVKFSCFTRLFRLSYIHMSARVNGCFANLAGMISDLDEVLILGEYSRQSRPTLLKSQPKYRGTWSCGISKPQNSSTNRIALVVSGEEFSTLVPFPLVFIWFLYWLGMMDLRFD